MELLKIGVALFELLDLLVISHQEKFIKCNIVILYNCFCDLTLHDVRLSIEIKVKNRFRGRFARLVKETAHQFAELRRAHYNGVV